MIVSAGLREAIAETRDEIFTGRFMTSLAQIFAATRGLAILLVVFFHSTEMIKACAMGFVGYPVPLSLLEYFPMPAFFLLIGMSLTKMSYKNTGLLFFGNRIANYLYIYIIWAPIYLIFHLITTRSFQIESLNWVFFPIADLWFLAGLAILLFFVCLNRRLNVGVNIAIALVLEIGSFLVPATLPAMVLRHYIFLMIGISARSWTTTLLITHPLKVLFVSLTLYASLYAVQSVFHHRLPALDIILSLSSISIVIVILNANPFQPITHFLTHIGRDALAIFLITPACIYADARILLALHLLDGTSAFVEVAPLLIFPLSIAEALLIKGIILRHPFWFSAPPRIRLLIASRIEALRPDAWWEQLCTYMHQNFLRMILR